MSSGFGAVSLRSSRVRTSRSSVAKSGLAAISAIPSCDRPHRGLRESAIARPRKRSLRYVNASHGLGFFAEIRFQLRGSDNQFAFAAMRTQSRIDRKNASVSRIGRERLHQSARPPDLPYFPIASVVADEQHVRIGQKIELACAQPAQRHHAQIRSADRRSPTRSV